MPALFALGFRLFFLLSALFALLAIALWVPAFVGWLALDSYYGQIGWHSHEMIFGYTAAVIAGFLLCGTQLDRDGYGAGVDFLVHLAILGVAPDLAHQAVFLGLNLVVLSIVIMGGRVIPFFPRARFRGFGSIAGAWLNGSR